MASMALFTTRSQPALSKELLITGAIGVQFYSLETYPRGDADTCFSEEKGFNVGDAELCPACGRAVSMLTWLPPFRVELELYGKGFGDFVFGHGGNDFLVSQRFRELYDQHGLTGLSGFDLVDVIKVKVKSRKMIALQPPMYFRVSPQHGPAALDVVASGLEWVDSPTCRQCETGNLKRWKRLVLEPETWKGEDVFRPRKFSGEIMVTQRFKDACDADGITNAQFTPAEESGHDFYPGEKPQNGKV
jgi:hypothetical protein